MVSNFTCKQFVDHNIITMVGCAETHSFLPFYNQTLGASTSTSFNITLLEEEEDSGKDYSSGNGKKGQFILVKDLMFLKFW